MNTPISGPKGVTDLPPHMKGPGEGVYLANKDGTVELWTHQIDDYYYSVPMDQRQVEEDLPLDVQRTSEQYMADLDAKIKRGRFDNREDVANQKPPRRR